METIKRVLGRLESVVGTSYFKWLARFTVPFLILALYFMTHLYYEEEIEVNRLRNRVGQLTSNSKMDSLIMKNQEIIIQLLSYSQNLISKQKLDSLRIR